MIKTIIKHLKAFVKGNINKNTSFENSKKAMENFLNEKIERSSKENCKDSQKENNEHFQDENVFNKTVETFQEEVNEDFQDKDDLKQDANDNSQNLMPKITEKQKKILKEYSNGRCVKLNFKERAKIILMLSEPNKVSNIAKACNIHRSTVYKWGKRWNDFEKELERIENEESWNLRSSIEEILSDQYRSGRTPKFTMIQVATILYLSLQDPIKLEVPQSHWTPSALAKKAMELGIVEKISSRQVGRYLKQADIKIHQCEGWLNSQDKLNDPEEFNKRVEKLCDIYLNSKELNEKEKIHIISTDEKTSIQALEHKHPKKNVLPGKIERCEQEYKRNGTLCLIASRDINTGKIIAPYISETRTEEDFVEHIKNVIALNPKDRHIFIMDQLNTHKSEKLVKAIAEACDIKEDLGEKGVSGILKSMESRAKFLEDESHTIRIIYTPKHTSWLNQIEIWFSIISRLLLNKRSSFGSKEELKDSILNFINYYNVNQAKPFKWTYAGKLLTA